MKPLRLWPGVLVASPVALLRWVIPVIAPDAFLYGLIAATAGAVLIVGWRLFFSRAPWPERNGALVLIAVTTLLLQ